MKFEIAHEQPQDEQKVTMWLETDPKGKVLVCVQKHTRTTRVVLADISEEGIQLWTGVAGYGIAVNSKSGGRMKIIT